MAESLDNLHDPEVLVARYLADPRPDLKDLIMIQFGNLVERIARKFSGFESQEDLVQVGYIGLLNALSKFDSQAGVKFTTYASHLIAGEIKHYLRDKSQTIRQPAWLQELRHKVNKANTVLQIRLQRLPSAAELAEEVGVSEQAILEVQQTQELLKVGSLDATFSDADGESDVDNLDSAAFCAEQLSVEDRVVLENAMAQLRDLEREVLVHFHFDSMNQTEIAHKLGISCNYVSHILRQSLSKLRRILTSEDESERELQNRLNASESNVIDPETGIYNEAYFRSRIEEEMHRAGGAGGAVSLVVIEFTGIQSLAAFYGDASVKDFFADTAELLRKSIRRLDILCRYGDTGFGIILPSTGPTVSAVIQRLANRLEPWLSARRAPVGNIGVGFGKAIFPDDCRTPQELLDRASQVLEASEQISNSISSASDVIDLPEAA